MFNLAVLVSMLFLEVEMARAFLAAPPTPPIHLDQGWTEARRVDFYRTAQGSQLIPFEWFLALEKKGDHTLFRDDANMERLRYLAQPATTWNPHGLPVGFVEDKGLDPSQLESKERYLRQRSPKKAPRMLSKNSLGFTCAACHTSRIEYGGKTLQIDGAPAMADFQTFLAELSEALEATHADEAKFKRFAERIPGRQNHDELKEKVVDHAKILSDLVRRNDSSVRYGFGRLDAFGAILNSVCDDGLDLLANRVEPNAPTSYPFLWNTPHLNWVQWNNSSNLAVIRNVGEVLGVFGQFSLKDENGKEQFDSTVRLKSLMDLECWLSKLKAPVWPEEIFGRIDVEKAKRGRTLFARNCASCHQMRNGAGEFPMIDRPDGKKVPQNSTPLDVVKTDRQFMQNLQAKADPGVLRNLLPEPLRADPQVPRAELLKIAVKNVLPKRMLAEGVGLALPPDLMSQEPPLKGGGYASRPLEGIWATAPYLHNGSVPNLYELLQPSSQRSKRFFIGSRAFDPKHVGFESAESPGVFEFVAERDGAPIPGNSNRGHEGHGATKFEGFTELFEDDKWREFTDAERWEIVEYLKSVGRPLGGDPAAAPPAEPRTGQPVLEIVPPTEAVQIENIVNLTRQQLKNRYERTPPTLRGVHPKDHGCMKALFEVLPSIDPKLRVGLFAEPGRRFEAWVRFSNADPIKTDDDPIDELSMKRSPGSRGMAIKVLDVPGSTLLPTAGKPAQDFVMVNQPVFAFSNVEDYEVLSTVLADPANKDKGGNFFKIQIPKGGATAERAKRTAGIIARIRAPNVSAGAFAPQPASPVDCAYYAAAPFQFGNNAVMKFAAVPVDAPNNPKPDTEQPNYLRKALIERLAPGPNAKPVVFEFRVQWRELEKLDVATEIEDACNLWNDCTHPFVTVARLTIEPQVFDEPARNAQCEKLVFNPWQGVAEFRPLGGINRMRLKVYEASVAARGGSAAPP